jgi:hypothetical protein
MKRIFMLIVLTGIMLPVSILAQEPGFLQDWSIVIDNTARYEHYDYWGNPYGNPYPETGGQFYNELAAGFSRRYSPYEILQGRADLLYNDSDYRSGYNAFVLERFNLTWEKGDAAVPFRHQLGDTFSFMSLRTIQRSLKGIQLEFQPAFSTAGSRNSVLFFSGAGVDDYKDYTPKDNLFSGASWLMESPRWGNYAVNFIHNHRARDGRADYATRNQMTTGLTGEKKWTFGKQKIALEGEINYFSGDYVTMTDTVKENASSQGYFGQLRGETGTPFTYRLRYENYGRDYKPNGALVNQDYEAYEAHGGWRFAGGLNLRGRLQRFTDGVSSGNPADTDVAGLALNGPLAFIHPALTANLDAFCQTTENRDNTIDTDIQALNLSLGLPVRSWATRLGIIGRRLENYAVADSRSQYTLETNLSGTHAFALASFRGSITPGLIFQHLQGNRTDGDVYGGSLGLQLARDHHYLGFNYNLMLKNAYADGARDDLTHALAANYRFTFGAHTLGLEVNYTDRDPTDVDATEAYRLAAFYTFHFEKPAGKALATAFRPAFAPADKDSGPEQAALLPADIIGRKRSTVMKQLAGQGITGGIMQPEVVVYASRLLDEIDERQRFGLLTDDTRVNGAVLVVDFDDVGNQQTVAQTFGRVYAAVLKRLGQPTSTYDQGEFSPDLVKDLNSGKLVRLAEWKTPDGIIRFGIPLRLDQQIRMELQYQKHFPPISDPYWSIENLY